MGYSVLLHKVHVYAKLVFFEYICEWYQRARISDVINGSNTWNQTDGNDVKLGKMWSSLMPGK